MYLANELDVNGRLLRGNVRMPDAGGPFPTIVFLHGFTVWKTGPQRLYEEFVRMAVKEGFCVVRYDFYGTGESEGEFYEMTIGSEMNETAAIYKWASEQPYVDTKNMFLGGHSLGALLALVEAPHIQPKATSDGLRRSRCSSRRDSARARCAGRPSAAGTSTVSNFRANSWTSAPAWTSSKW